MNRELVKVYLYSILKENPDSKALKKLQEGGLADSNGLTEKGRSLIRVVLAGGVFDIIHPGHIYFLRKAKELGDVLVVVVARDVNVIKFKGTRPMNDENLRRELVGAIKYVDAAILGDENDLMKTVQLVRPDIIALGYDQAHSESEFSEKSKKLGINLKVVRIDSPYPSIKSRNMKNDPRAEWI
ncbi:MAG: FAD synthase [Nitrososphaerota archaeon]|nr:FAD synthase [Nitrososphaerota archaeon]MDG6928259.1 FAD synthase [Nitrososphaerota archaeon]MDG6930956.1 FAD synthase [Nitrososphaerota archaeon]MDG6932928.1 FAD synthase [Nitrososphaerota archaeon]MDG6936349.1 FAD synthase [Nitrososphaerota archaeon]